MPRDASPQAPVALAVALVLLVVAAVWLVRRPEVLGFDPLSLSTSDVETLVANWGMWGIAGSVLLMVLHSFVPVPAEVIAVANGVCFGIVLGVVVTWSGAMLGAMSAFAIARWLGRPLVRRIVSEPRLARLDRCARNA